MRKYNLLSLLTLFALFITGCSSSSDLLSLEELEKLPEPYSLEQAKADGCVTHENGDITQGKELFETFFNHATSGKADNVRLAFYYSLDDSSQYDPDYYESIKDDYPALYILDLSFDGKNYTLRYLEDEEEISRNYAYLKKYEGAAENPGASYQSYVRYVLTNDDTVTWPELVASSLSSQSQNWIDYYNVCTDLIYET